MQLRQQRKLLTSRHRGHNPIQDGLFRVCSRMGGGDGPKRPPSIKPVTHILQ